MLDQPLQVSLLASNVHTNVGPNEKGADLHASCKLKRCFAGLRAAVQSQQDPSRTKSHPRSSAARNGDPE